MYEHPSFLYDTAVADQRRIDQANELRRVIAENPSRIVPRKRPLLAALRRLLGVRRVDATPSMTTPPKQAASGARTRAAGARPGCDPVGRAAHAR